MSDSFALGAELALNLITAKYSRNMAEAAVFRGNYTTFI